MNCDGNGEVWVRRVDRVLLKPPKYCYSMYSNEYCNDDYHCKQGQSYISLCSDCDIWLLWTCGHKQDYGASGALC